jgi:hypothetical protein
VSAATSGADDARPVDAPMHDMAPVRPGTYTLIQQLRDGIGDDDWAGYVLPGDGVGELMCGPRDEHGYRTDTVMSWCEEDEGVRPTPEVMEFVAAAPWMVDVLLAEVRRLRGAA